MNRWLTFTALLATIAGGVVTTQAEAQPPYQGRYDYGYGGRYQGGGRYGRGYDDYGPANLVNATQALASEADHLARATQSTSADPRLARDAVEFAQQADRFSSYVQSGADPRDVQQDFAYLARDFQELQSNFGRYGNRYGGRHLDEDFAQVAGAFQYTADAVQGYDSGRYGPNGSSGFYDGRWRRGTVPVNPRSGYPRYGY
jgi:hypothetical protein